MLLYLNYPSISLRNMIYSKSNFASNYPPSTKIDNLCDPSNSTLLIHQVFLS